MNITIYIQKKNEEKFKEEAEKSKLINELLDGFYNEAEFIDDPKKFVHPVPKNPQPPVADWIDPDPKPEDPPINDEPVKPKFKLTGKLCKQHQVDVDICKNMKH